MIDSITLLFSTLFGLMYLCGVVLFGLKLGEWVNNTVNRSKYHAVIWPGVLCYIIVFSIIGLAVPAAIISPM